MRTPATLFLLFAITCSSCSKDGAKPNEGTELLRVKSSLNDGTVSYRIYDRNSANKLQSLRDSITSVHMEIEAIYEPNGKVSRVNMLNPQGATLFYYEFEYNADGTVTKRQTKPGVVNLADDYNIYTYDASGHLVSDSQFTKSGMPPIYQVYSVNKFMYTGDNVTEAEFYSTAGAVAPFLEQRIRYDYDQAINPFKKLDFIYFMIEATSGVYEIRVRSQNNVTKFFYAEGNAPYELLETYSYKYNSSNYPWKLKVEVNNSNTGLVEAEYFYY